MYKYLFYGLHLEADEEIFQLLPDDSDAPADIYFKKGGIPDWLKAKTAAPYYEFGKTESWLHNSTGYIYVVNGNTAYYDNKENSTTGYDMISYMTGYGICMLLMQRSLLAVHCSAVYGEEGAVIISGNSGSGKSTVTNLFLDRGYELMADDIAAVTINDKGEAVLYPAFPYQKYCRDVAEKRNVLDENALYIDEDKDKFLVPAASFHKEVARISRMIILAKGNKDTVETIELSGLNKLFAFKDNLFLSNLTGEWLNDNDLVSQCLKLASNFPITGIIRPAEGNSLPEIEKILFP